VKLDEAEYPLKLDEADVPVTLEEEELLKDHVGVTNVCA